MHDWRGRLSVKIYLIIISVLVTLKPLPRAVILMWLPLMTQTTPGKPVICLNAFLWSCRSITVVSVPDHHCCLLIKNNKVAMSMVIVTVMKTSIFVQTVSFNELVLETSLLLQNVHICCHLLTTPNQLQHLWSSPTFCWS